MLPNTVGEIKALVKDLPDDMLFDLDLKGSVQAFQDVRLEVAERYAGYDGKPKYRKMLVMTIILEE